MLLAGTRRKRRVWVELGESVQIRMAMEVELGERVQIQMAVEVELRAQTKRLRRRRRSE